MCFIFLLCASEKNKNEQLLTFQMLSACVCAKKKLSNPIISVQLTKCHLDHLASYRKREKLHAKLNMY